MQNTFNCPPEFFRLLCETFLLFLGGYHFVSFFPPLLEALARSLLSAPLARLLVPCEVTFRLPHVLAPSLVTEVPTNSDVVHLRLVFSDASLDFGLVVASSDVAEMPNDTDIVYVRFVRLDIARLLRSVLTASLVAIVPDDTDVVRG